jgi:hypothetical protein
MTSGCPETTVRQARCVSIPRPSSALRPRGVGCGPLLLRPHAAGSLLPVGPAAPAPGDRSPGPRSKQGSLTPSAAFAGSRVTRGSPTQRCLEGGSTSAALIPVVRCSLEQRPSALRGDTRSSMDLGSATRGFEPPPRDLRSLTTSALLPQPRRPASGACSTDESSSSRKCVATPATSVPSLGLFPLRGAPSGPVPTPPRWPVRRSGSLPLLPSRRRSPRRPLPSGLLRSVANEGPAPSVRSGGFPSSPKVASLRVSHVKELAVTTSKVVAESREELGSRRSLGDCRPIVRRDQGRCRHRANHPRIGRTPTSA